LRLAKDITKELDRKITSTSNNHKKKTIQGLAKDTTREGSMKTNIINNLPQRKAIQMQENLETKLYLQHAIMGCLDPYPRHHKVGPVPGLL
jgi:hypothetical protein